MSYRTDAEVTDCSYGCTYTRPVSNIIDESAYLNKFKESVRVEFDKRTPSALWFVSNCGANLRVNFALGLGEHYPIKIYGDCENRIEFIRNNRRPLNSYPAFLFLKYLNKLAGGFFLSTSGSKQTEVNQAPRKSLVTTSSEECRRKSDCELAEFASHRYYLSFESKNCSNYITEKLWLILRTHMIPIVMQPSKEFYELNAPRNSFIHLQDFGYDHARLAEHLKRVDTDFNLYLSYHEWRMEREVAYSGRLTERRRFCEMCTKLNTETSTIYYNKVSDWYNQNCIVN
jgi:hypothetical protein